MPDNVNKEQHDVRRPSRMCGTPNRTRVREVTTSTTCATSGATSATKSRIFARSGATNARLKTPFT